MQRSRYCFRSQPAVAARTAVPGHHAPDSVADVSSDAAARRPDAVDQGRRGPRPPAIAAMGQIRSVPFRFHLDRSVDFIQHGIILKRLIAGLGASGAREPQFFVTEEGTIAAAYVVLTVAADRWTVEQCGDRDPTGARVGAILQALIARDPKAAAPEVAGWVPARPFSAAGRGHRRRTGRRARHGEPDGARRGDPPLTARTACTGRATAFDADARFSRPPGGSEGQDLPGAAPGSQGAKTELVGHK